MVKFSTFASMAKNYYDIFDIDDGLLESLLGGVPFNKNYKEAQEKSAKSKSDESDQSKTDDKQEDATAEVKHSGTALDISCPTFTRPGNQFTKRGDTPIQYIVIHYTAGETSGQGAAEDAASSMSKSGKPSSADFFVDQNSIVQYNPDYHKYFSNAVGYTPPNPYNEYQKEEAIANNGTYQSVISSCRNKNSVSIEMCSDWIESKSEGKSIKDPMSPGFEISAAVADLSAKLCAALMDELNVPIDKVVMHNSVSGKLCPAPWCRNKEEVSNFTNFKNVVSGYHNKYYVNPSDVEIDLSSELDETESSASQYYLTGDEGDELTNFHKQFYLSDSDDMISNILQLCDKNSQYSSIKDDVNHVYAEFTNK